MGLTIKTKIGADVIEATASTPQEAIALIAPFTEAVAKIRAAGEDPSGFRLNHRSAKGYDFYELTNGQKRLPFGQTQEGGKLFPKDVEDEYVGGGGEGGGGYDG